MTPYTITCTNTNCNYNWTTYTGFGVGFDQMQKFKCPKCDSGVVCEKYLASGIDVNRSVSATIVKGVGASDFKSVPSDWKNFMSKLHTNTKNSNMKDRF